MSIHISVGLGQVGVPDAPNTLKKAIRIGVCTAFGNQDTEALLSIADARMVAAMLITAADELAKQTPVATKDSP